jgi:hypothetical protein
MKPEGVTSGTIAGKPVILYIDDGGGYYPAFDRSEP